MFPLFYGFPFRKKDGSITTLGAAISGGGEPYVLPTASANTKGGVKIGDTLTMTGEVLDYNLPTAGANTKGGVKVGDTLTIEEGVLNYNLPAASASVKGGVKVGNTLSINDGVLDVNYDDTEIELISANVESSSRLFISKRGNTVNLTGQIRLKSDLAVDDRIQVSQSGIPSAMRLGSNWFPMVVTMNDNSVTKFTIATLTAYANGNLFINNNFADITARDIYISCSYTLH